MDFLTSLILNLRTEITEEIHYSHDYWIFLLPHVLIASDVVTPSDSEQVLAAKDKLGFKQSCIL